MRISKIEMRPWRSGRYLSACICGYRQLVCPTHPMMKRVILFIVTLFLLAARAFGDKLRQSVPANIQRLPEDIGRLPDDAQKPLKKLFVDAMPFFIEGMMRADFLVNLERVKTMEESAEKK